MFYGRSRELNELNRRYGSGRKEFGVIYGRRRIGKTELVKEFLKDKECLFFQAKKDNAYGNLRSFSYAVNKLLGLPNSFVFSNWEEALDSLAKHFDGKRFVLVIDEYPFIVAQDKSYSSVLQEFFDHSPDNLFLLLLGSDISFLKKEIRDHSSPLYKRRTFEMEIAKLNFSEATLFLEGMCNDDKAEYLSIMSSYPFYLAAIDKSLSFDENIRNLFFNQFGTFFDLPDQLLSNSTNIQDVYNAILLSIAKRHYHIKEISEDIHEDEAKVSKYLTTLLGSEIIEKRETFMGSKRTNYYVIADPMLRFWYTFIFDNQERIKTNGDIVFESERDKIHDFICRAFEDVAILYLNELNSVGALGKVFPRVQNFKADKTLLGRSVEIDGLAQVDNTLLVVECKYKNTPFSNAMMQHLKESASIFSDKWERVYYIFSRAGVESNFSHADNIHCYDLDKLFSVEN